MKSVQIRSFSGPYFPVFGLNTDIYIQSEYRRMQTRKTSVFEHFHAVGTFSTFLLFFFCLFIDQLGAFWQTVIVAYVFCRRKLHDCHTCSMKMFSCCWWGSVEVYVIFSNYCKYWLPQWVRRKKPRWVRYFWFVHHNFFVNSRIRSYDKQIPKLTHYSLVLLFYTPWKHQKT